MEQGLASAIVDVQDEMKKQIVVASNDIEDDEDDATHGKMKDPVAVACLLDDVMNTCLDDSDFIVLDINVVVVDESMKAASTVVVNVFLFEGAFPALLCSKNRLIATPNVYHIYVLKID